MTNPVALITGAARRIGEVIAETLHGNGYNLVLHYNQSVNHVQQLRDKFNRQRENSAIVVQADLCDMDAIADLADAGIKQWQRLDALINNASSFYPTPLGTITMDAWRDLIGTNLQAPLFLSQACSAALKTTKGCIINIADIHGDRPLSHHTVYCVAKAGNIMLTKSLAKELAPDIRVNGIAPGTILWPEDEAEISEDIKKIIINRIALKKIGDPADIATTIKFLLQDAPYITGQIIAVDGGRSLVS